MQECMTNITRVEPGNNVALQHTMTGQWTDYRKYLPGQVIEIRLKIEQNCRLFLDIFSSAIMNDRDFYIQA